MKLLNYVFFAFMLFPINIWAQPPVETDVIEEANIIRYKGGKEYVLQHSEISDRIKKSILDGKVLLGMCTLEAYAAAGGEFLYKLQADPKWGNGYFPPAVIFSQCKVPDSSKISMFFTNSTQFETKVPARFEVLFENGKATKITR